jgi:3-hydroxyisobutyrate dehydrogenase-like beta-hydroxyacid dehydrogenase
MAGDLKPAFMIDLINKDLAIVQESARNHKLPLPATNLAADLFLAAASNGRGRDGTQAVSTIYEKLGAFSYRTE